MALNQSFGTPIRLSATFTSSGTYTPPAGTTAVFVSIHGAGGGGGAGSTDSNGRYGSGNIGGTGGVGAIAGTWVQVTPGTGCSVSIGAGGGNQAAGGTTNFDNAFSVTGGNAGGNSPGGPSNSFPGSAGNSGSGSSSSSLTALPPSASALPRASSTILVANSGGQPGGNGGPGVNTAAPTSVGGTGASGIVYIYS